MAEIQKGELSQKEVHGCVEVGINSDNQQHHQVPHQGQEVNHQKQYEKENLGLRVSRKTEEDKLTEYAVVYHIDKIYPKNPRKKDIKTPFVPPSYHTALALLFIYIISQLYWKP